VRPVYLPPASVIGPDDCYIPAGRARVSDGDQGLVSVWIDGVVMRRNPVTNRDYLAFLNHLVAVGRASDAQRWAPRSWVPSVDGASCWQPSSTGRYTLPEAQLVGGVADAPVVGVSWFAAKAFAAHEADRTGLEWRLPHELEWEKAARGVDGRLLPWGTGADPSRACVWSSRERFDGPATVHAFPADESPYGCRHLAGNVHEWCENVFRAGVRVHGDGLTWPEGDETALRTARGASWRSRGLQRALSQRQGLDPSAREDRVGFRLARTIAPPSDATP
jgi:serine/threonine-protein kinase